MNPVLAAALALVFQATSSPPPAPEPPRVREIDVRGATVFDREAILGMIRLREGDPLRRDAPAIARGLANRYRIAGYPAARVDGRFDEATGRLALEVEEGRLREVAVSGLDGGAAAKAVETLGLEVGKVLREGDVWAAIGRLDTGSEGMVLPDGDPPWSIEPVEDGVRLRLRLRRDPVRLGLRPWGPRAASRLNRVDGLSLGLAGEVALTDAGSYNHFRLVGRLAYGFTSEVVRYTVGAERPFGGQGRFVLGYEYHDLTDTDDTFRRFGLEEVPGGTINTRRNEDLFRRFGHEAYAFARLGRRAQVGVAWRRDSYRSLPVLTDSDEENPPVEEGRLRSIVGTVRFASRGDLFGSKRWERESYLFPSFYLSSPSKPERWRAEATWEVSTPGLGSDFDFSRFIARARLHRPVGLNHAFDGLVYLGLTTGEPPRPKRFFLGGLGTLRGFDKKVLTGENMVLALGEWSFLPSAGFVPAVIPFYDGGALWGGSGPGTGWKHDVGLGLRWPQTSRVFVRVDAAVAIDPLPGDSRKVWWNLRVQVPF